MALAMKENEALDPMDVGFLRPQTVVPQADGGSDLIE
jgi:hypothetical protein